MEAWLALAAPVVGFLLGLVIGRLIFGEWLWQTSGKSRRNTKSSRLSSRQSQHRQKPQRKAQTANSSRRGHSVCSCSNCLIGLTCLRSKPGIKPFHCGDPQCDLCPVTRDANGAPLLDFEAAQRKLRNAAAEVAKREKERQKKYTEYVGSLDKLPGAIRMFRTWRLYADGSLKAMTQNHIWVPGENVTLANGGDASPDSGFYGFNSLEELREQEEMWWEWSQSGQPEMKDGPYDIWGLPKPGPQGAGPAWWYVCGTILAYGHVKASARGGRCQKAVPEYIIEPADADPDFGMLVVNAAEKYGMKIISVQDAEEIKTGTVPYWKGRPIE